MAFRTLLRGVSLTRPWRPLRWSLACSSPYQMNAGSVISLPCMTAASGNARGSSLALGTTQHRQFRLGCSGNDAATSDPSKEDTQDQNPPFEAVIKSITEVSKTEGRVGNKPNVLIGGTVDDYSANEWLALDKAVNTYPMVRGFIAIGSGGDDFVQSMVVAVESVIQHPVPEGRVKLRVSSRGKYVSVNIGPIQVISSEQVQAVYNAMSRDHRIKLSHAVATPRRLEIELQSGFSTDEDILDPSK